MKKLATRFMSMTMVLIAMFCFCAQPAFAQKSAGRAPQNGRAHAYLMPQSNQMRSLTSDALICVGGTDISHFTLGDPTTVTSFGVTAPVFTNSAEYYNGVYYYANSTNGDFGTIDPVTGVMTQITTGNSSASIALNPADGQMYGLQIGSSAVLYTIDPTTGAETQVVAVNSANFLLGMTITNDGRFLVIDAEIDGISELNPTTGDLTTIVAPGFTVNYGQDMAMDRETNTPYWAAYNASDYDGQLYSVDLSAGTVTLVGSFGGQVSGFATATTDNPNIAAAPTNFTVTPGANNALTATITWNNPTQTIGGTALTSITSVELYRGSTLLNSFANPTVGGAMSYTDNTVPADGIYSYRAYAITSEGNGLAASASARIGNLCDINFVMLDSYGDGWNGASVSIYNGTQLVGNATCSGDSTNANITVPVGNYSFVWNAGSYDSECSLTISDNFGYVIYNGAAPAAGQFATFNNTCAALPTSLTASPDTLAAFMAGVGTPSAAQTISINGWLLTNDITVTAPAQFEVSADGTTYGATATLPYVANANTMATAYVRYNPNAAGNHTGVVTLTSGTTSATVAVEGNAVSCDPISTFPYICGFEPDGQQVLCWETVDVDNNADGNSGHISFMMYDEDTNPGCAVYFYDGETAANDWLISPEFVVNTNLYASVDYLVASASYPETFSIYVIPQGQTYATATQALAAQTVSNTDWATARIGLGAYNGQTVRVAIHVESPADMYYIAFDNFTVDAVPAAELTATPAALTFSTIAGTATAAQTVQVTSWSLTENITVTTNAPFEVSADGNAFATTATLNYVANDYTNVTLYVRYNPTAAGTDNDVVTLTSTGSTATVTLTGTAVDCSGVEALPFTEDFEDELSACWQNIDRDGDGNFWFNGAEAELEAHNGTGSFVSASYINNVGALNPDNWLITPAIAIPAEGAHMNWYVAAQDPSYAAEYYQVMVSTSSAVSDFSTVAFSETLASGDWEERYVDLSNYAGQTIYIAFVHMNTSDEYMMKIDDINIEAGAGIEEVSANVVRVFPNPATNMINVEAQGFEQYQLVNMLGQTVMNSNLVNGNAQINVSNLSNGVYYVRLINGNTVETIKVIKK